ncbi:glycosyltransferase [Candidatus Gottesmanbacteria bacterium]|nr:glycosyltransferase [Candidatus Gottesmanbacteria bacterium]
MKNSYLIFLPFHNPWVWHTDYANQTAVYMSRHHTVLCFLWGDAVSLKEIIVEKKPYRPLRKMGRMIWYQPLFLIPGKRILAIQFANLFINLIAAYILCSIMAIREKKTLLFWFFGIYDPVFLLLPVFFRYTRTLYDCVDTPSHPDAGIATRLTQSEALILKHAWIVTANSKTLYKRLTKIRTDVHLVPLGFRNEIFTHPKTQRLPFSRQKPVIGYIGAIDYRIDFPLLYRLISHNTQWQFAIIGPVFYDHMATKTIRLMEQILKLSNVYHTKVPAGMIPGILARCDITIIPYRSILAFNRKSFPMKTMEYLYAGKPIVASQIDELAAYHPLARFAGTQKEWEHAIREIIRNPLSPSDKRRARVIAASHTWKKKVQTLNQILQTSPDPA